MSQVLAPTLGPAFHGQWFASASNQRRMRPMLATILVVLFFAFLAVIGLATKEQQELIFSLPIVALVVALLAGMVVAIIPRIW